MIASRAAGAVAIDIISTTMTMGSLDNTSFTHTSEATGDPAPPMSNDLPVGI